MLESFAARFGEPVFAHAELDVLLMRPQPIVDELLASEVQGVFAPRESEGIVMASFLVCTSVLALRRLLEFFDDNAHIGNEMDILGAASNAEAALPLYALPSVELAYREQKYSEKPWPIFGLSSGLVIDGAVMGRWLLGVDPRNTPNLGTRNLIQNPPHTVPFSPPLDELDFRFDPKTWTLLVRRHDVELRVATLHIHSKVFSRLTAERFTQILKRANKGKSSIIVMGRPIMLLSKIRRMLKDLRLFATSRSFREKQNRRIALRLLPQFRKK